jgi:CheY-like chemotaxis protein
MGDLIGGSSNRNTNCFDILADGGINCEECNRSGLTFWGNMQKQHQKILLVDDDQDLLDLYKQILSQLPSQPEILTAGNGARAVAMIEEDLPAMLICDLKMPKMDGLQVLSIVRRKYPQLRTVVLTSVPDEEFRSRAYALGVDLFWQKPASEREIKLFLECLESLLGRGAQHGFRGVQSKSLVDIIQLECISQNSLVLRVTNGPLIGKIWINNGEIIDATAEDLCGEIAFRGILSWKAGSFETLPAEPEHPRAIQKSYNGLLLETVQAIDESKWQAGGDTTESHSDITVPAEPAGELPLVMISRLDGAEFALVVDSTPAGAYHSRGLENPNAMATWARQTMLRFGSLSDRLRAGQLSQIECAGPHRNAGLAAHGGNILCMGWRQDMSLDDVRERTRKALIQWAS